VISLERCDHFLSTLLSSPPSPFVIFGMQLRSYSSGKNRHPVTVGVYIPIAIAVRGSRIASKLVRDLLVPMQVCVDCDSVLKVAATSTPLGCGQVKNLHVYLSRSRT